MKLVPVLFYFVTSKTETSLYSFKRWVEISDKEIRLLTFQTADYEATDQNVRMLICSFLVGIGLKPPSLAHISVEKDFRNVTHYFF